MCRRSVGKGVLGGGDPVCQPCKLPLQLFDQLPLPCDSGVQILNRLVLMGHTDFKLIKTAGII